MELNPLDVNARVDASNIQGCRQMTRTRAFTSGQFFLLTRAFIRARHLLFTRAFPFVRRRAFTSAKIIYFYA